MQKNTSDIVDLQQHLMEHRKWRCYALERTFGRDVIDYISKFTNLADPGTETLVTCESLNVQLLMVKSLHSFVNLKRINDINEANEFFSIVNQVLPPHGLYIGCVETLAARKRRILDSYPKVIAYPYIFCDFIIRRILPKIKFTRRFSALLTRNVDRPMSITETLGRLNYCGFELVDHHEVGYLTYYVCRKVKEPVYSSTKTYGFVIRLKRIGLGGKLFNVYKFRTMHPYAEHLQEYICKKNSIQVGGKFKEDYRVTAWGRFMRKLWIDEQPMWLNWLRKEVKLVGVRPLSEQFFSLYPEEFQQRRIKYKPGLIPPFYRDLPGTLDEIIASERKYLDAYDKCPWLTDLRYFWMAIYNIVFKRARSA